MRNFSEILDSQKDTNLENSVVDYENQEPVNNEESITRPVSDLILGVLYKRYAEEILQWYHYWTVSQFMCGAERPNIEKSFGEFADDELNDHAAKILKRINELNGDIEMLKNIDTLKALSDCEYVNPSLPYDTIQLVTINVEHEKCAIKGYKELCDLCRESDPVTYDMAVDILTDEEEHLRALEDYLNDQNIKA